MLLPLTTPQRILVAPLRFIGDIVLTVPLLRALKTALPHAKIDVLVPQPVVNLLALCPYISDILVEPKDKAALKKTLTQNRYDTAIGMRRSVTQAFLFRQAGIPTLIGFDSQRFPPPLGFQRWHWFLSRHVPFPPADTDIPQVRTYLNLLSPLGIHDADPTLELWITPEDIAWTDTPFNASGEKPLAVIHCTSASREKALPADRFAPSVAYLTQQGYHCVAVGTAADSAMHQQIAVLAGVEIHNLCGQTTLRQTAALLSRAQLLFSIDSAPIHLAAAMGTPQIVGLYGPTNPRQWRPYPYSGAFTAITGSQLATGETLLQSLKTHLADYRVENPVS